MANVTGFQKYRRELAAKELEAAKVDEPKELTIDEIKIKLTELGVSFHPNAGLKNLEGKLKEALANGE